MEVGTFTYANTNYILLGMIIEKLAGRSLAAELNRRLFAPLGMRDTYLPAKAPEGIKGPHGHGYAPDKTGTLRDVDKLTSPPCSAPAVWSPPRATRAPSSAPPPGQAPAGVLAQSDHRSGAGHAAAAFGRPMRRQPRVRPRRPGSAPGFTAATYPSSDGRLQFAVSLTPAMDDAERSTMPQRITEALKSVFCPATQPR
ncbi:serine hydrolase domain-containing protein [Nonomuraea sp. B19D2]|uniref:serine hydrolase domain-containing protein n=1 Tax=Nonomuraea sp. B19D2 TaxID=3159561 RepID=UPI0032D9C546